MEILISTGEWKFLVNRKEFQRTIYGLLNIVKGLFVCTSTFRFKPHLGLTENFFEPIECKKTPRSSAREMNKQRKIETNDTARTIHTYDTFQFIVIHVWWINYTWYTCQTTSKNIRHLINGVINYHHGTFSTLVALWQTKQSFKFLEDLRTDFLWAAKKTDNSHSCFHGLPRTTNKHTNRNKSLTTQPPYQCTNTPQRFHFCPKNKPYHTPF